MYLLFRSISQHWSCLYLSNISITVVVVVVVVVVIVVVVVVAAVIVIAVVSRITIGITL